MSAGADATRALELADIFAKAGHDWDERSVDERCAVCGLERNAAVHHVHEVAALLRRLAAAPANDDLLAALKVCGIEPPENDGEPWSLCLNENGPEEGGDTATDTARMLMDAFTKCDQERERLATQVPAMRFPRYMMGTIAWSGGVGKMDISRDEPDLLVARNLDRALGVYVGEWCIGYGFMEVRFPVETTRDLTPEEIATYRHKVAVATFAPGTWPALEDGIAVGPDAAALGRARPEPEEKP